ncbi:MAG: cupin domain-containing protein [Dehalococcoidia bacterium]
MTSGNAGFFLEPGEGRKVSALGLTLTFRAATSDTEGQYLAAELEIPPGGAVPPHIHHDYEEGIYVLEGEVDNRIEDRSIAQGAGSFCFVKRGTVHGQINNSSRPVKLLLILSPPASPESLFNAIDGQPDERVLELMREHGMEFVQQKPGLSRG